MEIKLRPDAPLPLFRQIADALRYRIGTGAIARGSRLPSLRDAASRWGVNLHTVRRAYKELEQEGLVTTSTPGGTSVCAADTSRPPESALDDFAREVTRELRLRYQADLDDLLAALRRVNEDDVATVWVVECSRALAQELATGIQDAFRVRAHAWDLADAAEVPAGKVVGTYFHYNELRRALGRRIDDLHFVAIRPDARRLLDTLPSDERKAPRLLLCETDAAVAHNIAADLVAALGMDSGSIEVCVPRSPSRLLRSRRDDTVVFSPRSYEGLSAQERSSPRAHRLHYLIDEVDLATVADSLGWRRRTVGHQREAAG